MAIVMNPNENVFYPQPYLEGEANELVITNRRMIRITDAGMAEFPIGDFGYVGRLSKRPWLIVGVVLLLGGLSMLVIGIVAAVTNRGPLNAAVDKAPKLELPPIPIPGQPPPVPGAAAAPPAGAKKADESDDEEDDDDAILGQIGGLIMAGVSLLLIVGGVVLMRIQRHQVVCRAGERVVEIECKDKPEQTMILATLSSAVSAGKMAKPVSGAAAAAAAAKAAEAAEPEIVIPDNVDPVKALQELKVQKDAGKVDEKAFEKQRAALLKKLASR